MKLEQILSELRNKVGIINRVYYIINRVNKKEGEGDKIKSHSTVLRSASLKICNIGNCSLRLSLCMRFSSGVRQLEQNFDSSTQKTAMCCATTLISCARARVRALYAARMPLFASSSEGYRHYCSLSARVTCRHVKEARPEARPIVL